MTRMRVWISGGLLGLGLLAVLRGDPAAPHEGRPHERGVRPAPGSGPTRPNPESREAAKAEVDLDRTASNAVIRGAMEQRKAEHDGQLRQHRKEAAENGMRRDEDNQRRAAEHRAQRAAWEAKRPADPARPRPEILRVEPQFPQPTEHTFAVQRSAPE